MVKVEDLNEFMIDVEETFGFLMAQEILKNPLTPKDTSLMAQSFPGTYQYNRSTRTVSFKTPYYTKFVHNGTYKMKARPFVIQTFNQKGNEILKQAFKICNNRWKNK